MLPLLLLQLLLTLLPLLQNNQFFKLNKKETRAVSFFYG
jgi:hemolysin-activating ACP:hemolysin acyltransferase